MKGFIFFSIFSGLILFNSCSKDTTSERFKLLTGPVWTTESLLANGIDASGPGQILEKFKGDANLMMTVPAILVFMKEPGISHLRKHR